MVAGQAEDPRRLHQLAFDADFDLRIAFQIVPHQVDLVQHGYAARDIALHILLPDVEVGFGDTGIHRQKEQYGVRTRNQGQRQFGLGAERVQARSIEDDQALLQQRMRIVDQRMAPARDLDFAPVFHYYGGRHEIGLVEQPEQPGLLHRYRFDLGEAGHRRCHVVLRCQIEPDLHPFDRLVLQCCDALVAFARFDRQQLDVWLFGSVVENLGRAHGRAADIGGQQALLEIGKKHRVDQFGLAAREFREEGENHAVVAQALDQIVDAQAALDVRVTVVFQPVLIGLNAVAQFVAPLLVRGYLVLEIAGHECRSFFTLASRAAAWPQISTVLVRRRSWCARECHDES